MSEEREPPKNRKRFGTIWGELDHLCKRIHHCWHVKENKFSAKRYLRRLERVLTALPENDTAILREEGLAWLHQIRGEINLAIKHRQQEIQLIEQLHSSVRHSVMAGDYDESMATSILAERDLGCLQERRDILTSLMDEETLTGTAKGYANR